MVIKQCCQSIALNLCLSYVVGCLLCGILIDISLISPENVFLWLDENQYSKWCSLCQFVVEAVFCENWLLLMLDALGKPACYEYKSRSLAEWIIQSPLAPLSLSLLLLWAGTVARQVPCKAAKATSAGFSISPNAGLAARKRYLLLCNKKKNFATAAVLSSSVCTCIQGCTRRTHLRNCWERLNSDLLLNNFNFKTWLFLVLADKLTCILFFDILKNFFHWPEHHGSIFGLV